MIIRIRGIKRVRAKGRIYYYHRKSGQRIVAPYDTAAFASEVAHLDAAPASPASRRLAGTLGALVEAYRASPEFTELAERTRKDYFRVFDYLAPIDEMPVGQLNGVAVMRIRDRAFNQKKRRFANYVLQVLALLCSWGMPRGFLIVNPVAGVKKIPRPKNLPPANRPWSDAECEIVLTAATGGLKVAIGLGMFAALRIGMAVRLTWTAFDGQAIEWRQKTDATHWLPVHSALRKILDETPRVATTMVVSEVGRPYRPSGLAKAFRTLVLRLMHEGRVGDGLTFHGLRHTAGRALADLGCDPRTIAAMLGHESLSMAIHYSEGADRRRRASAAIVALEGRKKT